MLSGRLPRAALAGGIAAAALAAAPADAATLRAGAGRADITPRTGYYLGGWTRADRVASGQHTRLHASALVLASGRRKLALVAVDLFMVPAGLVKHAAERAGFSERNVLVSASHTHSGPGGYANFRTFNTAAPSLATVNDPFSFARLLDPEPADRQLYTFLVDRIATAIRRAERDLAPAAAAWGSASLHGVTSNRSVEAHLANHGLQREFGEGAAALDPDGVDHTIDPGVSVLRVDKLAQRCTRQRRRRSRRAPAFTGRSCPRGRSRTTRVPIGGWSTFADHGTVTKSSFQYYNQDHHASALRVFEARVRRAGRVPRRQRVVNVYGNSNEGDQSAGLVRSGPAASDLVGRLEAAAMLRAWRRAGPRMTRRPVLDHRWTRACFCGQRVDGGAVADYPMIGIPFLTGSEEERGPLHDVTGVPLEGRRNPAPVPGQGHKLGFPLNPANVPTAVPLAVVRVGSRLLVSMPGEPTAHVGRRLRAAVLGAVAGSGVRRVVVSGLANEFVLYFTTPEEYDRQHYEGGATLFGPLSSPFLTAQLGELARRLVRGQPAQAPYPFDPTNGVRPDGPPYGAGAARGALLRQPASGYRRLEEAELRWHGGRLGLDRPLDRGFVVVERRVRGGWLRVTSDLGLQILWTVDDEGRYRARWEIPLAARRGVYRFVVRAKRYRLTSSRFRVRGSRSLRVVEVAARPGRAAVRIDYPAAVRDRDLTFRPRSASGGVVTFRVGSRTVVVRRRRGTVFSVRAPAGARVSVPPGGARDRYGNLAPQGLRLQG